MSLLGLVLVVALFCVVYWAVHRLMAAAGMSPMITAIVDVVLVLALAVWLLQHVGVLDVGPRISVR